MSNEIARYTVLCNKMSLVKKYGSININMDIDMHAHVFIQFYE